MVLAGDKPWKTPAKFIVLWRATDRWRLAIHTEIGILDGFLNTELSCEPEIAQMDALQRASELAGLSYSARWRQNERDWWTAEISVASNQGEVEPTG